MGSSFGLKKKKKIRSKADEFGGSRKKRRAMAKPDSKPSGFEKIPEDIFMEIMTRLPAKLVTRLKCVSQLWRSLISSRVFTKFFLDSPSSAQRRRPLMYRVDIAEPRRYVFVSSWPHDHSDASVTVLDQYLNMQVMGGYFVNALRGLLCVGRGRGLRICNLTTKQLVELPVIRSRLLAEANCHHIWSFFGYDSVLDEYKVLITVWKWSKEEEGVVRSEHQVLVLGPGASWRNTHISAIPPPPHRPYSNGISINGVLYYGSFC